MARQGDDRDRRRLPSLRAMEATIEVNDLRKRFGPAVALDGVSFTVSPGQVTASSVPTVPASPPPCGPSSAWMPSTRARATVGGRPYRQLRRTRCSQVGACWTPRRCSPAAPDATTCCGWRTRRACRPAGRRGDRAGRSCRGGRAPGGWLFAGHAPAAGHRRGPARRSAGPDARRAVQRTGSRGNRVDPRLPALAGRARAGRSWCPAT